MRRLGISSRNTLQRLCDESKIEFSKDDDSKRIMYSVRSIEKYFEDNAKGTFS